MKARGERRLLAIGALLLAVLAATHAAFRLLPSLFEPLSAQSTDRLFELRARLGRQPAYQDAVVHVDIDDRSRLAREEFYLDRDHYARLIRNLGEAGVAAQLHDVIFAAPKSPEADRELLRATADSEGLYYGMALGLETDVPWAAPDLPAEHRALLEALVWRPEVVGDASTFYTATRPFPTFPALAREAAGLGFLDIVADRDGVYRRTPLLARYADGFLPSSPLVLVCRYLGVGPEDIVVRPGHSLTLRGARRPGEPEGRDLEIPIDRQGRMLVNYIGPWGSMRHYPFQTVYQASDDRFMLEDLRAEMAGRIAVVSWVSTGEGDIGPVPTDPLFPLSGLHANAIHTMLTGEFLRELGLAGTLGAVELPLLALLLWAGLALSTTGFVGVAVALALGYYAAAAGAFVEAGLILDVPRPLFFVAGSTVVVAAYQFHLESKARAVLRTTFNAYFPPSVVDKVMGRGGSLMDAAQKKELTILFSDIKSFTTHSAPLEAGHVRDLLNEYFDRMVEIVFRHGGTVDKFIGDGLMVFFGDPEEQPDHALRCVRAAIEMQQVTHELEKLWTDRGDMPLQIRVGINTGVVTVGNMGSERHVSYTVLGAPVNLAQRLESNAPVGGILISKRTWELVRDDVDTVYIEPIFVKGIDEPIPVYTVSVR